MSTSYLISRTIDPIFAVSVGVAAAVVRINRDEKAKGHSTQGIIDAFKRRSSLLFANQSDSKTPATKTT